MNTIIQLMKLKMEVERELQKGIEQNANIEKYNALNEIEQYCFSFKYIKTKKSKEIFQSFLCNKSDESTRGMTNSQIYRKIAEDFKCTPRNIEQIITSAKENLEFTISNSINFIRKGDVSVGINQFRQRAETINVYKELRKNISSFLPQPRKSDFIELGNCIEVIAYLKLLVEIEKMLKTLDQEKLSYILYILETRDYPDQKKIISDFLEGLITLDKMIEKLIFKEAY